MKKLLYLILIVSATIIYFGCDDSITVQDVDNREIPDSNVSFSKDIAPIFELKCVTCHGSGRLDGGVDLTTWSGVVDPRIVIPGEADTSPLVWTIEWRPGFPPMPPANFSVPLTTRQINGVKNWINEGAKNN
jgi:Planctomycete cytochrome C